MILNYSSKREKRKLIYFSERKNNQGLNRYKAEAMPRKSMLQGYKTSNSTGPRTNRKWIYNPQRKSPLSLLECRILSCKNDDRHPYDKRNTDTATKLNLPELKKSDRETGGAMLNVTGMNRFYYLRNFHDMRCKYGTIHHSPAAEPRATGR